MDVNSCVLLTYMKSWWMFFSVHLKYTDFLCVFWKRIIRRVCDLCERCRLSVCTLKADHQESLWFVWKCRLSVCVRIILSGKLMIYVEVQTFCVFCNQSSGEFMNRTENVDFMLNLKSNQESTWISFIILVNVLFFHNNIK
jgi:hypothetical protein